MKNFLAIITEKDRSSPQKHLTAQNHKGNAFMIQPNGEH